MMHALDIWAAAIAPVLETSSDSDDVGVKFGLLFLVSGFVFYGFIYFKYRNVDKRHKHEVETEAKLLNMQEVDQFVKSFKGLAQHKMAGANNKEVRGARRKGR